MTHGTDPRRYVIPPAVQASRMQRYSLYLIVMSFLLVGVNYRALTLESVLWFAAGVTAGFALLCAVAVVILHAIAWNFDRLRDEWSGRRGQALPVGTPDPEAPRRPSSWQQTVDADEGETSDGSAAGAD